MLSAAQQSLCHLSTGLEDKTEGQQWHRLTNRVLTDLNHRCLPRTTAEEWNLAAYHDDHDVKNVEFMRTFRSIDFDGLQLLERSEAETKKLRGKTVQKIVPPRKKPKTQAGRVVLRHFPELYGYRGGRHDTHKVRESVEARVDLLAFFAFF